MCNTLSEQSPGNKFAESVDLPIGNFIDIAKLPSMKIVTGYSFTADENGFLPILLPIWYIAKLWDL